MCDICEAIKMGMEVKDAVELYLDSLRDTIKMYGMALTGVSDGAPPFCYTVGRTDRDLPELLITGLDTPQMAAILNNAADLPPDEVVPGARLALLDPDKYTLGVIKADPEMAEMDSALALYGHGAVTALQLVWPDMENRLPGEKGYLSLAPQPVFPLGETKPDPIG